MTVKNLGVNTFGSQVIGINNYAPAGSGGGNLWIGNGGQSSQWAAGSEGTVNVGIGTGALFYNTKGFFNMAAGTSALLSNTIGNFNVAIGGASLSSSVNGDGNTAIGGSALESNISGSFNIGIGYVAVQKNTIGGNNVGIGSSALVSNISGSGNTAVGSQAMRFITSGDDNVSLGRDAGSFALAGAYNTSCSRNIYIGSLTKTATSGSDQEIVIGYGAMGNGSNTTTIGNSTTTHTVFQYGKTLVGYSAAQDRGNYALQVNGQIYATNAAIATSDARLKERIAPLSSGLKEVMALRPCTFDFKQGSEQNLATGRQVGFIAQEVASVLQDREWASSVVQEAGGNLGIAETKLLPLLVKAVQEQQAQIEKLSAQLSLLQSQISQLERKAEATKSSAKRVAHSK